MQIIKKIFSRLIFTAIIIYAGNSLAEDAWSSHYSFSNYGQKGTQLIQADLIKKGESDYYDNIGKTYIGVE